MTTKRREQERQVKKRTDQKRKDHTIYVARHSPPLARLCSTGILCFYEQGMALMMFVSSAWEQDRAGGSVGHSKYKCNVCMQSAPDPKLGPVFLHPFDMWSATSTDLRKSMQMHFESKHPKEDGFLTAKRLSWSRGKCSTRVERCWTPKMDLEDLVQDFSIEKCTDLHASAGGVTTQGVAVRGANRGRRDVVTSYLSVLQWLGRCRNQCLHDVMWATHVTCIRLLQMLDYSKLLQMVKCFALLQVESKNITTESGQAMPSVQKLSLGVIVVITWSRV